MKISPSFQFWLFCLELTPLDRKSSQVFWNAYEHLFKRRILGGATDEPRLNISWTMAFRRAFDPTLPAVFRRILSWFLTFEVAQCGCQTLSERITNKWFIGEPEFRTLVCSAPNGDVFQLKEFAELLSEIHGLETRRR